MLCPILPPVKAIESPLLHRLPLELREMVYQAYFGSISLHPDLEKVSYIQLNAKRHPDPDGKSPVTTWHAQRPPWLRYREDFSRLFCLCRQVYEESTRVYYRRRVLKFRIGDSIPIHAPESIGSIVSIRDYLIGLAARHPSAFLDLEEVNIRLNTEICFNLPEFFDLLIDTQKILSNWRRPGSLSLPFFVQTDFLIFPGATSPFSEVFLPIHDLEAFKAVFHAQTRLISRYFENRFSGIPNSFKEWLRRLDIVAQRVDLPMHNCIEQAGCKCNRHIGRTLLAKRFAHHTKISKNQMKGRNASQVEEAGFSEGGWNRRLRNQLRSLFGATATHNGLEPPPLHTGPTCACYNVTLTALV